MVAEAEFDEEMQQNTMIHLKAEENINNNAHIHNEEMNNNISISESNIKDGLKDIDDDKKEVSAKIKVKGMSEVNATPCVIMLIMKIWKQRMKYQLILYRVFR